MGYFVVGALVLLCICIVVGLAGGLIYLIYLPFKKRLIKSGRLTLTHSRRINKIYILVLFLFAASQTYFAFFPTNSFYKDEFKYNTGINLPSSADIIDKDSDYPDMHGDYWASAIIRLNKNDYDELKKDIAKKIDFEVDTTNQRIGITHKYDILTKDINTNSIDIVYSNSKKEWFKLAFLKDGRTIIFERSST